MYETSVNAAAELDACKNLSLEEHRFLQGYGLVLLLQEHLPQPGYPENPERDYTPEMIMRLGPKPEPPVTRLFEIRFREVISLTLTNETYSAFPKEPEVFSGNSFRVFSQSHLLELTRKTTFASDDHPGPGPLQHFEFICMDDIIDVISCAPPEIRRMDPK